MNPTEPNRLRPRLTIFGAGHVAMPTARLARQIGFHVTVVDDREDWNTSVRFPLADERKLTAYTDYPASQPMDPGEYALVVTQGHDHDEEIVRELSRVPLAYLGMIGSTRKVERTRRRLPPSEEERASPCPCRPLDWSRNTGGNCCIHRGGTHSSSSL